MSGIVPVNSSKKRLSEEEAEDEERKNKNSVNGSCSPVFYYEQEELNTPTSDSEEEEDKKRREDRKRGEEVSEDDDEGIEIFFPESEEGEEYYKSRIEVIGVDKTPKTKRIITRTKEKIIVILEQKLNANDISQSVFASIVGEMDSIVYYD